ncbi:MAG: serine protein kinase [Myxococcales bacterium]|nr:MAG: serine protein kinase [Myxococcales bacterium]
MPHGQELLSKIGSKFDRKRFKELNWEGSFSDYLELVSKNPDTIRTAFQRVYDMIMSYGTTEYLDAKKRINHYHFFDDPVGNGQDAVYGLDVPLMKLVNLFRSAAQKYGTERRVILLHGPVGSSKSTIVRMLKKGLEAYSRTDEGALYTFSWVIPKEDGSSEIVPAPMNEEPLLLIPKEMREDLLGQLLPKKSDKPYRYAVEGGLSPVSRYYLHDLMKRYDGDWLKIVNNHIRVRRLLLSEQDRIGVGTFQPKDEKNQDSTELTGDVNYRKIAEYGTDSDPRAFNFDGEFNIANRGLIEFIEVLKLDVAFLYDLLGASQEHSIKPKKFAQTDIDEVIIGHTNEPEYRKLQNNEYMEALRDRTVKVDIPYITKMSEEVKIYRKHYDSKRIPIHIAPHTLEVAATWAVLTRLEEPSQGNITTLQKAKLYDGRSMPDYTEDTIVELRKMAKREGMEGISPRYIQDKISNALVRYADEGHINPFMVMNELEAGLRHHSLITNEKDRERFRDLLSVIKQEYEDIIKNEVQRAISADEEAIQKLCANYVDNVKAYTLKEKVRNPYTGHFEEPDERLMRSIEEKINIPDSRKDDFRREIMNYIGALALEGKTFNYRSNERLDRALEMKLFEDQKDAIKLTSLVSNVVDKEAQKKIDVVKERLIKNYGYNEQSATDVLNYVASIFARGDSKER